jgi:hypothetical protein
MRIGYPLSESVAPPGTAWGAEGQRGNEATENNLMVLAPAQARKGQSYRGFAQEDMPVRFRLPASTSGSWFAAHDTRNNPIAIYFESLTCSLFSSYAPNFFATGLSVG